MTKSKDDKREIKRAMKAQDRADAEKSLPAPKDVLQRLFDHLDVKLPLEGCDHTLRLTLAWAAAEDLDGARIAEWTRTYGGYCDCEVLANVESSNPAFGGI